jgi:hypothetical protein
MKRSVPTYIAAAIIVVLAGALIGVLLFMKTSHLRRVGLHRWWILLKWSPIRKCGA